MLGTKFYKENYDLNAYAECAEWCNANNCTIEDKGEYYECVAIPAPALNDVKQAKIEELKAIRNAKELEPIKFNGYLFDFDKDAIMRIQLAVQTMQSGENIVWTDANNNRVNGVNADDLNAIMRAGRDRSNELHICYNELKAIVNNAETVEQVNAIEW